MLYLCFFRTRPINFCIVFFLPSTNMFIASSSSVFMTWRWNRIKSSSVQMGIPFSHSSLTLEAMKSESTQSPQKAHPVPLPLTYAHIPCSCATYQVRVHACPTVRTTCSTRLRTDCNTTTYVITYVVVLLCTMNTSLHTEKEYVDTYVYYTGTILVTRAGARGLIKDPKKISVV